jgi:glyoxylase-like metal-dependent hydrolase (beta-lactamase superfamily II)
MPGVHPVHYPGLDPRIRVYRCEDVPVDSFAVLAERFAVIVDTLISRDAMRAVLADLGTDLRGRQLLAVNTHGDWDHVWGNGLFVGPESEWPAPVIAHELVEARMDTDEARSVLEEKQAEDTAYATAGWNPPTIALSGSARIEGGDLSLHLLPTPGHTPDHLSVWIPQLRLLLAGDAAEWPFPEVGEDPAALRSSLRRMLELRPQTVLYCHAPGRTDPGVIEANIAYFDELERRLHAGEEWPAGEVIPPQLTTDRPMYESFHRHNTAMLRDWLRGQ